MFNKIAEAQALPNYRLDVRFCNGEAKRYDVSVLFAAYPAFRAFQNAEAFFQSVQVDVGGYAVVWSDELDLSYNELYENGTAC
ncbi:MAG: DUF2442 domain-containing protein [Clostridiales bacterium]|nr:DUF2442 domain-containing protein [Clostridiales bacterium]